MQYTRKGFLQLLGMGAGATLVGASSKPRHPEKQAGKRPIKPPKLNYGDTIGLISPGFSLPDEAEYGKIEKKIQKLGFKVKAGAHAKDHFGYFAGTDKNRASDVNNMFANPGVNAIMCFRGGWGCDRLLDYLDFDVIRRNPKPLIGFSDITTLLLAIHAKTGLVTFHGPLGVSKFTPFTMSYFKKALMKAQPFTMSNMDTNQPKNGIQTIKKGIATGRLLGGNLSVLTSMCGSNYLPDWDGSLLFLEDVGEEIYSIDRMLTQLHLNGVFEKINGFIFGKCTDCPSPQARSFTLGQILHQHLDPYNIPAFSGADFGHHIPHIFTLPVGVNARMDAGRGTIRVLESPVEQ